MSENKNDNRIFGNIPPWLCLIIIVVLVYVGGVYIGWWNPITFNESSEIRISPSLTQTMPVESFDPTI